MPIAAPIASRRAQGVYKRALKGQAASADGEAIGKLASVVAQMGVESAQRYTDAPDRLSGRAGAAELR